MGHVVLSVIRPARVFGSSKRNTISPLEPRQSFMPTLHVGDVRTRVSRTAIVARYAAYVVLCCAVILLRARITKPISRQHATNVSSTFITHMCKLKAPRYHSHAPHYRDTPLASLVSQLGGIFAWPTSSQPRPTETESATPWRARIRCRRAVRLQYHCLAKAAMFPNNVATFC
jgi:hypothetical protein